MKLINVIDENGKSYSSTYVKRAKGLVKHDRAYWVDDSTICLRMPLNQMEEKIMTANDFERMIALTVASNYTLKNKRKEDFTLGHFAVKTLCDTYDGIITELENANIEISPGLEKINYDNIEKPIDANKLVFLENYIFTKNCLLNPILKLEKEKLEKKEKIEVVNTNSNKITINVGTKSSDEDLHQELSDLQEELESLNEERSNLKEELSDLEDDLDNAKKELEDLIQEANELQEEINELQEEIHNCESSIDAEELSDMTEELESKIEELDDVNDDIEDIKDDIEDLEDDIDSTEHDIYELDNEIEAISNEISEVAQEIGNLSKN